MRDRKKENQRVNWYWIVFSVIAVFIPAFIFGTMAFLFKKYPILRSQKSKQVKLGIGTCILWEINNLFVMACVFKYLVLEIIFGSVGLFITFADISQSAASPKEKTALEKWLLLFNFAVAVVQSVCLIYMIPDASLQTIVLAIAAALFGGLITLTGVAWTIRKSDKDRKEEAKAKAKPYFTFVHLDSEPNTVVFPYYCYDKVPNESKFKWEAFFKLENSNQSVLILSKIYHDGKWFDFLLNKEVIPGGEIIVSFHFDEPSILFLKVADIYGNSYYYKIDVAPLNENVANKTGNVCLYTSVIGIYEASESEIAKTVLKIVDSNEQGGSK